jgi:hypothetical protein
MRSVYIVISQGNTYRDMVRLGMLRHLLDTNPDLRVVLLTQAYAVPEFLEEVRHERVLVLRHDLYSGGGFATRLVGPRRRARRRWLIDAILRLEAWNAPPPVGLAEAFERYPPSLVVSTHPLVTWEWDVIRYARSRGVRTAAIVKSWDNVLRRLVSRPDALAVWSRTNRREALEVEHYRENEVEVVGAAAFDRYFTPGVVQPRDAFWSARGLDPRKPVILFGTAGMLLPGWDETFMLELLLELTEEVAELRGSQILCRLHPVSELAAFWRFREHPRVTLSFGSYVKTLGWCMTRAEVDEMANMLAHADVVVTPASTLSIEGPVFDTPTVVTLFSTVRPEQHAAEIERYWLSMHFKPILANDWLPLARDVRDLRDMLVRSLADRAWYRKGRTRLLEEYVTYTDGRSYERVAAFIASRARRTGDREECSAE